jgi:leader peptidase (prepilin peptidase)/N-methyltransferase
MEILVVVAFAVFGFVVGGFGRWLLSRISAGARCGPPWCELATAGLSAVLAWRAVGGVLPWWWLPVPLVLGWLAVPLAAVDLTSRRLPNAVTLPAYPVVGSAVAVAATAGPGPALALRALAGAVLFGGAHAVVRLLAPGALGGGDVKLAGSLGMVLGAVGWPALAVAVALAALVTVTIAVARRARSAPHGPGLLAATWVVAAFPATAGLTSSFFW